METKSVSKMIKRIRYLIFGIVMLALTGCGGNDDNTDVEVFTSMRTRVFIEDELSTGEKIKDPAGIYHFLFDATGKNFSIASYGDLLDGFAYDATSDKSYEYTNRELETDGSHFILLEPGDYFVVVIISDSGDGRYSYTNVTLSEGDALEIEKIFDNCCPIFSYEAW